METAQWSDLDEEIRERLRTEFKVFIESALLYQKHNLEHLPVTFSQIKPEILLLYCPICRREQPFRDPVGKFRRAPDLSKPLTIGSGSNPVRNASISSPEHLDSRVYDIAKRCTGCEREQAHEFVCWVEVDANKKWARKVGQVPPWTKRLDTTFEKALGSDTQLYCRALDCISRAYGLGACAYLRRVVEH